MSESKLQDSFIPMFDSLLQHCPYLSVILVYGEITRLSIGKGYSYAAKQHIAEQTGLDIQSVKDAINILLKAELIVDTTPSEFHSKRQVRHYQVTSNYDNIPNIDFKKIKKEALPKSVKPKSEAENDQRATIQSTESEIGNRLDSESLLNSEPLSSRLASHYLVTSEPLSFDSEPLSGDRGATIHKETINKQSNTEFKKELKRESKETVLDKSKTETLPELSKDFEVNEDEQQVNDEPIVNNEQQELNLFPETKLQTSFLEFFKKTEFENIEDKNIVIFLEKLNKDTRNRIFKKNHIVDNYRQTFDNLAVDPEIKSKLRIREQNQIQKSNVTNVTCNVTENDDYMFDHPEEAYDYEQPKQKFNIPVSNTTNNASSLKAISGFQTNWLDYFNMEEFNSIEDKNLFLYFEEKQTAIYDCINGNITNYAGLVKLIQDYKNSKEKGEL